MSSRALGAAVGVSAATVARWASGESRASVAEVRDAIRVLSGEPERLRKRAAAMAVLLRRLEEDVQGYMAAVERLAGLRM